LRGLGRHRRRGSIWLHDFGSNRLYAIRHPVVHFRERSSHDKVPRQCPF